MEILIKNATILSGHSLHNGRRTDIYIKDGLISRIDDHIPVSGSMKVIEGQNLFCTTGLTDIGTHTCDPGYEHRENMSTLARAARKGGYTTLVPVPNTLPYIQTKADVQYLIQKGSDCGITVYPLGALSLNGGGIDIAEYIDMFKAGAVGFSDGLKPCQDAGLLLRALTYVKTFDGLIIHHPEDKTLRGKGLMHEGLVSTSLGLMGVPVLAEVVALQRDLLLRDYSDSKLLVHAVSAADSLLILKKAREKSEKVFVSASYLNLIATDENVRGFHSVYKVKPVLRSETDRDALLQAVKDDIIDVIVSNHVPVDEDGKKVEFPYAESGAGGIETAFIATLDALAEKMDIGHLVSKFNDRPREILGLPPVSIMVGQRADICIFERGTVHVFDKSLSLSANNPLLNHTFRSRVIGSVLGDNPVLA